MSLVDTTQAPLPIPAAPQAPTASHTREQFVPLAFNFMVWQSVLRNGAYNLALNTEHNAQQGYGYATQAFAFASAAETSRQQAETAAVLASQAPTARGSSTTALTISAGVKNLTVETERAFMLGQAVVIAAVANPTSQRMYGIVTAYNPSTGALSVTVSAFTGSGTLSSWTVTLGNAPAVGGLTVVNIAANSSAATGNYHVITSAGVVLTMPATPALGDEIGFCNASNGDATVNWNGRTVKGTAPSPQAMILPRYGAAVVKFNGSTWA